MHSDQPPEYCAGEFPIKKAQQAALTQGLSFSLGQLVTAIQEKAIDLAYLMTTFCLFMRLEPGKRREEFPKERGKRKKK